MPRRATRPLGQWGEETAARFLEARGLRILARNVRFRLGEIDLIARDGMTLVVVEVKTRIRGRGDPPQVGVDSRKRMRLTQLAFSYLTRRRIGEVPSRFDVVAVTRDPVSGAPTVDYFPNAFALDT
ncbi:MAG: YraN family protein [Candidatus Rokuibacteriota bacterium]